MRTRSVVFLILGIILAFLPGQVSQAQDHRGLEAAAARLGTDAPGRQVVFLIAVDKYKDWPPLKNPVGDAREIAEVLRRRYYIDECIELYDEDATRVEILRKFESLIGELKPEDSLLIYYAGHGQLDKLTDMGFWIPQDAGTDPYEQRNWLSNQQIRNMIAKMKSRHVVLVSDSCFSGDILNASRGPLPKIDDEYFRAAYSRRSRQVLTSGASETVPDESSFSRAFELALEENRKPYLDPLMIFGEVRLSVKGTTPLFGVLNGTDHQEGGSFLLFLRDSTAQGGGAAPTSTAMASPTKLLGSLRVEVESAGSLYVDGVWKSELRKGGALRLPDLEVGYYDLEMRYSTGEKETRGVKVQEGKETEVQFLWKTSAPLSTTTSSTTTTTTTTTAPPARQSLIEMVPIQGGSFTMGSNDGESDEKPTHRVTVSSFMIGKYEVTQGQYQRVVGTNPSYFTSGSEAQRRPVEQVSWYDAVSFCNRLSDMEGLQRVYTIRGNDVKADFSRNGYRLPTEAEWEFAARGGNQSRNYTYSGSNDPGLVAWYTDNSGYAIHPVGTKGSNELGLYDMSGNVWEWCWDWYESYSANPTIDPIGASANNGRVDRGGSSGNGAGGLRSVNRGDLSPGNRYFDLGFRIVRRP